MKYVVSVLSLLTVGPTCMAACSDMIEHPIGSSTKVSFAGFDPSVKRYVTTVLNLLDLSLSTQ